MSTFYQAPIQRIIRAEHRTNFTMICNETLRDKRLRREARLLLAYLLGMPTDWKINVKHLAQELDLGENLIRKCIKQLIEYGYATRERIRKERGRFADFVTSFFERPNLGRESIVTTSRVTTCGGTTCDGEVGIQSKEEKNSRFTKETFNSPPTSSAEAEKEEIKIDSFLGIKSNLQALTTLKAMLEPLHNAISTLLDQPSAAAPPVEKPKVNPLHHSTDEQAPIAGATVLRKLSEITNEGVESLRTNLGLQKALKSFSHNLESALEYLEHECKSRKIGVGFVVMSLREGRKATRAGGATWKEWADRADAEKLLTCTYSYGSDDIMIQFRNGEARLWSEVQKLSWDEVTAIVMEDVF